MLIMEPSSEFARAVSPALEGRKLRDNLSLRMRCSLNSCHHKCQLESTRRKELATKPRLRIHPIAGQV